MLMGRLVGVRRGLYVQKKAGFGPVTGLPAAAAAVSQTDLRDTPPHILGGLGRFTLFLGRKTLGGEEAGRCE